MLTDAQIVAHLHEIIRSSDLRTTTATAICRRLEADLGVNLSQRRMFIVEEIDKFVHGDDDDALNEGKAVEAFRKGAAQSDLEQARSEGGGGEKETEKGNGEKRTVGKKCVKASDGENKDDLHKLYALSPQLQKLFGVAELSRTEVVKKLWAYIKERNLRSPKDRKIIICDKALRKVFGVREINMFEMSKGLLPHISSLDEAKASAAESSRKQNQQKMRQQLDRLEKKEKPTGKGGIADPTPISDSLVKFIGTGECELSRTEAVRRIWIYIKEKNLQDPSDRRMVLCDDKLKELFEVDTFHGFALSRLLHPHFPKKN